MTAHLGSRVARSVYNYILHLAPWQKNNRESSCPRFSKPKPNPWKVHINFHENNILPSGAALDQWGGKYGVEKHTYPKSPAFPPRLFWSHRLWMTLCLRSRSIRVGPSRIWRIRLFRVCRRTRGLTPGLLAFHCH